jgi:PKD repeat protein
VTPAHGCRWAHWAVVLVAFAALALTPSADALIIRAPHGRRVGVLPRTMARAKLRALAQTAVSPRVHRHHHRTRHATPARTGARAWPSAAPLARAAVRNPRDPLIYHNGPVLGTHRTYAIYWDPSGQQPFPTGFQTSVDQFLGDVAQDSGGHANVYSVSTQYRANGQAGVYASTYTAMLNDINAYPLDQHSGNNNGCTYGSAHPGDPAYTYCLTDAQIQTELQGLITQNQWPSGEGAVYFVFLPPGVDTCMGPGAESPSNACADQDFCAYHDATGAQPGPSSDLYGVLPYADISGCRSGQSPNGSGGNSPADDMTSILSHEHTEAITDPLLTGWYDIHGDEIGDKCASDYGSPLGGPALGQWNQLIAGHHYYLQQEWSNAAGACAQRDLLAQFSVAPSGTPATYTFDASSSIPAGGIASYAWSFGDGASASSSSPTIAHTYAQGGIYVATLTVTDSAGNTNATTHQVTVTTPGAAFAFSPSPGYTGQAIRFDGSASSEANSSIVSWTWSFGDGTAPTTSSWPTISHFFLQPGTYPVTLTVRDSSGNAGSVTHSAVINAPILISGIPPSNPPAAGAYPGPANTDASVKPRVLLSRVGNAQLVLSRGHLVLLSGRALNCVTTSETCSVSVTVTTRERGGSAAAGHRHSVRTVAIATATMTTAPGSRAVIKVTLNGRGAALARRLHRLSVALDLRARFGHSQPLRQALRAVVVLPGRGAGAHHG